MEGGADLAEPPQGGADPATSTNSTDAKGKLPRTPVRHALYNVPARLDIKETKKFQDVG